MNRAEINIQRAICLAVRAHSSQFRHGSRDSGIGKIPYITHPFDVLKTLAYWGIKLEDYPDMHIAAIFHDIIEDTHVTIDALIVGMQKDGPWVQYVEELTFDPKKGSKEEYMASFPEKLIESFVIKLSDRVNNVFDFQVTAPDYALKYFHKADTLWGYFWGNGKAKIVEKFGIDVWLAIRNDIESIRDE